MAHATKFRTLTVKNTRSSNKGQGIINAARDRIGLNSELGDRPGVEHVAGSNQETEGYVDRQVKSTIDFEQPFSTIGQIAFQN